MGLDVGTAADRDSEMFAEEEGLVLRLRWESGWSLSVSFWNGKNGARQEGV